MEVCWRSSCSPCVLDACEAVFWKAARCSLHYNVMTPGGDGPLKALQCLVQGIKICLKTSLLLICASYISHSCRHITCVMWMIKQLRALVLHWFNITLVAQGWLTLFIFTVVYSLETQQPVFSGLSFNSMPQSFWKCVVVWYPITKQIHIVLYRYAVYGILMSFFFCWDTLYKDKNYAF